MTIFCSIRNFSSILFIGKPVRILTKCEMVCYVNKQNRFYSGKQVPHLPPNKLNVEHTSYSTIRQVQSVNRIWQRSFAKKRRATHLDSESSDEEDDLIDKYDKNCKIIRSHMTSLRLDAVLKAGLGLGRNKVDTAFYESRIRLNGEKVSKKSQRVSANNGVNVGDEVDLVKGISSLNSEILNISRVEVISAKPDDDEEEIIVKMKRFKSLQIENYEKTPYTQQSSAN